MNKDCIEIEGKKVRVWQVCECDSVAAETLEEARTWYKEITGFDDDELYDPEEVEIVSPRYKVRKSEEDSELISVKEIVEEYWLGEPMIVTTMGW